MNRNDFVWYGLTSLGAAAMLAAVITLVNGGMSFMFFGIASIGLLGVRDMLTRAEKLNERQQMMRQLAEELGFEFRESAPVNVLGWSQTFELTKKVTATSDVLEKSSISKWIPGIVPKSKNILEIFIEDIRMVAFDCPIPKSNETESWHTVVSLKSPELEFPHFGMYPRTVWNNLSFKFRKDTATSVHEKYRLVAKEMSTLENFDGSVLEWLDGTLTLEVGEGYLLLYRSDKMADAKEIEQMIRIALQIHTVFAEQSLHESGNVSVVV